MAFSIPNAAGVLNSRQAEIDQGDIDIETATTQFGSTSEAV